MQAPHSALLEPARAQRGQAHAADGSSRSHASHNSRSPLAAWHSRQSCGSRICLILVPIFTNGRNEIDKWKCFPEDALVAVESNHEPDGGQIRAAGTGCATALIRRGAISRVHSVRAHYAVRRTTRQT